MADMVDAIADKLIQGHIELMNENYRLKALLAQCKEALEVVSYVIDPAILPKEENMVMYALGAIEKELG
jgi:hypothetical protein